MGLLNFGKRQDRDVDEYFVKGDDEKSDTMEEGNISGYIEPDDLNYSDYDDIIDTIENNGWTRISSNGYPLSILNKEIVYPNSIKANNYGTVLEIICPLNRIITMCGVSECNVDIDDFRNSSNFFQVPHFITLRCTNSENIDIFPTTIISILKINVNEEPEKYYETFYGDLSPISDGKLKKKHERYYLAETIILQSGEKLIFRANNPNVDISKIDLLMKSDIFEKDEEKNEEQIEG